MLAQDGATPWEWTIDLLLTQPRLPQSQPQLIVASNGDLVLVRPKDDEGFGAHSGPRAYRLDGSSGEVRWGPSSLPFLPDGGEPLVVTVPEGFAAACATPAGLYLASLPDHHGILTDSLGSLEVGSPCSRRLEASRARLPLRWNVISGTLPTGLVLTEDGSLTGTPEEEGDFPLRLRLTDFTGRSVEKDLPLSVGPGRISVLADTTRPCFGGVVTLTAPGPFVSWTWLPGG